MIKKAQELGYLAIEIGNDILITNDGKEVLFTINKDTKKVYFSEKGTSFEIINIASDIIRN